MRAIAFGLRDAGSPYPLVYDVVVRCVGWEFDKSIYAPDVTPTIQPNNRFPVLSAEYDQPPQPTPF